MFLLEIMMALSEILIVLPEILVNLPGVLMVSIASNEKLMVLPEMLIFLTRIVVVWPEILVYFIKGDIGGLAWDIVVNNGLTCDINGFILVWGDNIK